MIEIYTDGSSCGNRVGPGGWSYVVVKKGRIVFQLSGGLEVATNNQMELMGPINALKYLHMRELTNAAIYTDSQYVQKGITEWIHGWRRNGWKSASGEAVKNQDLWKTLHALRQGLSIEWNWVRGHNGNTYNEVADTLAKAAKEKYR